MSRYIMLWEYNVGFCPLEMKDKVSQWITLTKTVKKMLKSGEIKEWAHYAGESGGYVIVEGNDQDVLKLEAAYLPFINFTSKPVLNLDQCLEVWKSLK
jgi:hypothetical protein